MKRRGVTLLEVLFAIVVFSVGLLAVLATLTMSGANIRKGENARLSQGGGESAVATFEVEGMNRRDRWIAMDWTASPPVPVVVPVTFQQAGTPLYGYAFCIDPMGWAHNRQEDTAAGTDNSARWSWFPAVDAAEAPHAGRMVRLNLTNGAAAPMAYLQADKVFRIEDQLIYERPDNNALPAVQLYTKVGSDAGRRQEEGRLTWFATLVPKYNPLVPVIGDEYVLSIVVCRNRSGEGLHVPGSGGPEPHPWPEVTAEIQATDWHADGFGGGEVTITERPAFGKPLDLKSGAWVMLGRTLPSSTGTLQYFGWYKVSDSDEASSGQQNVTLIGADWHCDLLAPAGTNEPCDVTIVPEVVHVLERTVKIQQ
jgi:prepilin-type N-terminal cleavage/methylation domain-containing protein